ncbi:MAG TPA: hypothetical protein VNJ70_18410 [Thermoanaerobaculia bacterium]|nr:hypothetical protein [Thermoanaerobaculia bacterium]
MPLLDRRAAPGAAAARRLRWAVLAAGLALSAWMVARSQVGGDQLNLLARGWLLIEDGVWVPYGNPTSMGGAQPGGLSALLVALPIALWRDHRAASALVLLTHLAAYLLLDRTLRRALTPLGRLLFAVLYWLNPWRLYFSAFLWNPNWLFLPAVVHLWSAWEQRERARFWPSFLHVLALALGFQIHASVVLLGIATVLLLWRRAMRLHWGGAAAAALLGAAALLPWALAAGADPGALPAQRGFPFRGLLLVAPFLKGLLYWFRYASLGVAQRMADLDFASSLGEAVDRWLEPAGEGLLAVLGLTIVLPLLANARLWRRPRRWLRRQPAVSARGWVRGYVVSCFAAAALTFALAPTTIMMWQALVALHAAVLPPVLWAEALARSRRWGRWAAQGAWAWATASLVVVVLIALGSPHYRCGGDLTLRLALRHEHPMLHELGVHRSCPLPIRPDGWWPDVLPEPSGEIRGAGRTVRGEGGLPP